MADFRMPALGADMEAGTLVAFRRKPGERLQRGDIIAEVETDKGVIEVEYFGTGVLERYLVETGSKVPVGTPLAVVREDDGGMAPTVETKMSANAAPASARVESVPAPIEAESINAFPPGAILHVPGTPSTRKRARAAEATPAVVGQRLRISPAARKRAEQLGIAIDALRPASGVGPVTLRDVEASPTTRSAAAPSAGMSAMRRAIAQAMSRSKREIPHYYVSTTIDLSAANAWLTAYNASRPVRERLLSAALLLKAVALATRHIPELNAHFAGEQLQQREAVHVGVAVSLRGGGLVAPAIHDADRLPLPALMSTLDELVLRARSGRLRSSELSDASLTVTNLGERGVESVLPIIHPPQTAMVGFGRVSERPWVVSGQVVARPLVQATLAGDHRATDGHLGARYLATIDRLLQEPGAL